MYRREGILYRQVNQSYQAEYDHLMSSGLYARLVAEGLLIPHQETSAAPAVPELAYRVISPEPVTFVSYPYEWCFGELKAASLATLQVQSIALEHGMTLKDASAYNIQFHHRRPVLIDTLSFGFYEEGQVWVPYRQFCQHFLAPLAMVALKDVRLAQLLRVYIDGVPLDLASALLPARTRLSPTLAPHIHWHARAQTRYAGANPAAGPARSFSRQALLGLIDSLRSAVAGLRWEPRTSAWLDYADDNSYSAEATTHKRAVVHQYVEQVRPETVWDLGANTGIYSRVAAETGAETVAFDSDATAVEANYRACIAEDERRVLPLVLDLTNPSAALGWANRERDSLAQRGPAGLCLALALVHHLAIASNVPLPMVAAYLAELSHWLAIEFVPRDDPQVQRLLRTRQDIFDDYDQSHFERAFGAEYAIVDRTPLQDSSRIMYLMGLQK